MKVGDKIRFIRGDVVVEGTIKGFGVREVVLQPYAPNYEEDTVVLTDDTSIPISQVLGVKHA